jgi:hypothetical protein
MAHRLSLLAAALLSLLPVSAQERDFLTAEEVDQVREIQEPNERLKLYTTFAKSRIAAVEQLLSRDRPGRSSTIHQLLDDYAKIIESMDLVADDALKRKLDVTLGVKTMADAEKEFLATLEKIKESNPKDVKRYEFVLDQAIDATSDSYELSATDLKERQADVLAKDAKEKKERDAIMKPASGESKEKQEVTAVPADDKPKRKAPTLRRPGEEPPPK